MRGARLVSKSKLLDHDPKAGTARYEVRELHGSPAHFPIREETVRGKLEDEWAYVVRGDRPLSLEPVVMCSPVDAGARHDVFVANQMSAAGDKGVGYVRLSSGEKKKGK